MPHKKMRTATFGQKVEAAASYQKKLKKTYKKNITFPKALRTIRERSAERLEIAKGKHKRVTMERRKEHEGKRRVPMIKMVKRKAGKFGAKKK